jgi:aminotransferase EvaB
MHPLKLINVWGDGGITVTNDDDMADNLRLLRNHGLRDRDTIERMGYNTRLDTIQAVVGSWILRQAPWIANSRCEKAVYYDNGLKTISQVRLPIRRPQVKHTYLLYIIFAEQRDELLQYCLENGIEAKIHYPVPLYQQPGLKKFGYEPGDFPVSDRHANEMLSFPVDQHLTQEEQDYIIKTVKEFYKG